MKPEGIAINFGRCLATEIPGTFLEELGVIYSCNHHKLKLTKSLLASEPRSNECKSNFYSAI